MRITPLTAVAGRREAGVFWQGPENGMAKRKEGTTPSSSGAALMVTDDG